MLLSSTRIELIVRTHAVVGAPGQKICPLRTNKPHSKARALDLKSSKYKSVRGYPLDQPPGQSHNIYHAVVG